MNTNESPFSVMHRAPDESLVSFVFRVWQKACPDVDPDNMPHDLRFQRTIVDEGYGDGYEFARLLREMVGSLGDGLSAPVFAGYSDGPDGLTRTVYYAFNSREDGEIHIAAFYEPAKAQTFGHPAS